jgi:hypothetical protein
MIVGNYNNPANDLYCIGGHVIHELESAQGTEFDYIELYRRVKETIDISNNVYALTLDWLYLLGVIEPGEKGTIKKCF